MDFYYKLYKWFDSFKAMQWCISYSGNTLSIAFKLDRVAMLKADPTSANFIQPLSYGDWAKFNRFEYKSQTNVFVESFDFT